MSHIPQRVPDLATAGQVQVRQALIVPALAIDVFPGGLSHFKSDAHVRVIDMGNGIAWYAPVDKSFCRRMAKSFGDAALLADVHDTTGGQ